MAKNVLKVTGANGDTQVKWDPALEAEVESAFAAFNKAVEEKRGVPFRVESDPETGDPKVSIMKDFDPEAETIIVAAPIVAG